MYNLQSMIMFYAIIAGVWICVNALIKLFPENQDIDFWKWTGIAVTFPFCGLILLAKGILRGIRWSIKA